MKRGRMSPIQKKINQRATDRELIRILNENFRDVVTAELPPLFPAGGYIQRLSHTHRYLSQFKKQNFAKKDAN